MKAALLKAHEDDYSIQQGLFGSKVSANKVRALVLEHLNTLYTDISDKAITVEGKKGAFFVFFPRLRLYWYPSFVDHNALKAELRTVEAACSEVYTRKTP